MVLIITLLDSIGWWGIVDLKIWIRLVVFHCIWDASSFGIHIWHISIHVTNILLLLLGGLHSLLMHLSKHLVSVEDLLLLVKQTLDLLVQILQLHPKLCAVLLQAICESLSSGSFHSSSIQNPFVKSNVFVHFLDPNLELVLLLGQVVDVFEKLDVILAQSGLVRRVLSLISLEFLSQYIQVLLHLMSLRLQESVLV